MKKYLIVFIAAVLAITLAGCAAAERTATESNAAAETQAVQTDAKDGAWTILLYLCGSDLETDSSAATDTIKEILGAAGENTRIVIQTGGAKSWHTKDVKNDAIGRYCVENGELCAVGELPQANMGAESTLTDFLRFGTENYPAEHTAVVFWDHGGGSLAGVCRDENYGGDALSLAEIKNAFAAAEKKFDLVGFDACLMSTLETALAIKDGAEYMVASQEIEPTGGWDYKELLNRLSQGSVGDGGEFGRALCDAYAEKYKGQKAEQTLTLSVIDLAKLGGVSEAMDGMAGEMSERAEAPFGLSEVVSAALDAEQYGGGGDEEGFSNMVDIKSFSENLYGGGNDVSDAVSSTVVYQVRGELREDGGGLSFYYPLKPDEQKISRYAAVSCSDKYTAYLNTAYVGLLERTVLFDDSGSTNESGEFVIDIADDSLRYVRSVQYYLLELSEGVNEFDTIVKGLGRGADMSADAAGGKYASAVINGWPAINGTKLYAVPVEEAEEYIIYSSPILLNGEKASLRFSEDKSSGEYDILGVWGGTDPNTGMVLKKLSPLNNGDEITIMFRQNDTGDMKSSLHKGETVTVDAQTKITHKALDAEYYQYAFVVTDVFGTKYFSDTAVFSADEKGGYAVSLISKDVDTEAYTA